MRSFSELQDEIAALVAKFPGQTGLVVEELASNRSILFNEKEHFIAASIIKLPILWELFRQIETGVFSTSARIHIAASHKVGGSGILHELDDGLQPTISDLATLMIILSDNTATNLLIEMLGFDLINQTIRELGLRSTLLQRKMMDIDQAQQGFENYVSASDVALLLRKMWQSKGLTPTSHATMLDILKRQQHNDRLSVDFPEGTLFAHKTGQLPGIEHDAGILIMPQHVLILVALTRQPGENLAGPRFCGQVGRLVYDHYRALEKSAEERI
jgi:beta-lactamase class A